MKVYEFLRGDNINELLNFILKQEKDSTSEDLGYLIANSYNYHEVKTSHLNYADLNNEKKIVSLTRLFTPINGSFESESVFSSGYIFYKYFIKRDIFLIYMY